MNEVGKNNTAYNDGKEFDNVEVHDWSFLWMNGMKDGEEYEMEASFLSYK